MVNAAGLDPRLSLLLQGMDGLSQRQQAIAGNIANVDTPGYRRRDVPFEAALRASIGGSGGASLATTQPGHIASGPAQQSMLAGAQLDAGPTSAMRNDGNSVDIDYEMTQLAETSLRYEALAQAASSRYADLRSIIGQT
jgi:flagellar basal-body rod protein FlgB